MRKLFSALPVFLTLWALLGMASVGHPASATPAAFGVAAHDNVNIEWWYVNAHITTDRGRHLALVGSFFRFGNGRGLLDPTSPLPRAHYLIYAVTDLDKKTQRPYSLADTNMVALLKQIAPLLAVTNPKDKGARTLLASLKIGRLPPPSRQISGVASVVSNPFRLAYGIENTLTATNTSATSFALNLGGGQDKINLTLSSRKKPMAVGGKGETGLTKPTDMYYYSLTRCTVGGTIDTGAGPERITGGQGWFDHQWGNSWVAQNDGWDWWGVQLDDGTDILFFRQRNLSTGKVFFPLATFMDKDGHQTVTKNMRFVPIPTHLWKSPRTGVKYPLAWDVWFPDKQMTLAISTTVKNQEMPILGPGSGIWEGACDVTAIYWDREKKHVSKKTRVTPQGITTIQDTTSGGKSVSGVAYMELVGYNSPAVKALVTKGK